MNIKIVKDDRKSVSYFTLGAGDVFKWEGHVYLITSYVQINGDKVCVRLDKGHHAFFASETQVEPVEATLTVREIQ